MKSYVYAVPEGVEPGGQILLTVWSDRDLERDPDAPAGDYQPEDRYEIATRPPTGWDRPLRVWGPPLGLDSKT